MGRLDGKVALITGGARGQGRSHAVHLAGDGADIVITDNLGAGSSQTYPRATQQDLDETVGLVESLGRKCVARIADVRDLEQMQQVAAATVETFGKVDILLANAGILTVSSCHVMTAEMWHEMIDVNLTGVFNSFRAVLPSMIERRYGRIVATSSTGGRIGNPNIAHYSAAKWGVIGLVKSVALEVADLGITVNAVTPTNVDTLMIQNDEIHTLFTGKEHPTSEEVRETFLSNPIPVPWLDPSDVSKLILFFVSDDARYISGETLGPRAGGAARGTV